MVNGPLISKRIKHNEAEFIVYNSEFIICRLVTARRKGFVSVSMSNSEFHLLFSSLAKSDSVSNGIDLLMDSFVLAHFASDVCANFLESLIILFYFIFSQEIQPD